MVVILARDNHGMHWLLHRPIEGIDVIVDRRGLARRSDADAPGAQPHHGERRTRQIDDRLREFGWAVVYADAAAGASSTGALAQPDGERCAVCGDAIEVGAGRYRRHEGVYHIACYEASSAASALARRSAAAPRGLPFSGA